MAVPTVSDQAITIRTASGGSPRLRGGTAPKRVISVLFDTGIEEWRRGWRRASVPTPDREAIVSASDLTRGAAATTQVASDGRTAYTVLGAPVEVDRVIASIEDHLIGVEQTDVHLIVDNVEPLVADHGAAAAERFISGLRDLPSEPIEDVILGCSIDAETDPALATVFELVDAVEGRNSATAERIDRLRRDDPTTFGYVRRHWAEAQRGIEACDRNYPQSKQVHAEIVDPETTPRTLGATLSGLVTLGALDTWTETVGPTRYDLTAYRPESLWDIGLVFVSSQQTDERDDSTDD